MESNEEFIDGGGEEPSVHNMTPRQGLVAWYGPRDHTASSEPTNSENTTSRTNASRYLMLGIALSMVSIGLVRMSSREAEVDFTESVSTSSITEDLKWLDQNYVLDSSIEMLSDNDNVKIDRPPNKRFQPTVCPPGSFCPTGAKSPILCPHGFYCPEASVRPVQCMSGMFCPEGSKDPKVCRGGHFCPAGSARELPCPPQHYCALGSDDEGPVGCPEGTYCPKHTEFPVDCPAAHFCPAKSHKGLACPAQFYCPTKTSLPTLCPAGHYCLSQTDIPPECPGGTFCPAGTENPEPCPSGAYCKEGSTRWIKCPASYFCPAQSRAPKMCPSGSYCPEGSQKFIPCPMGFSCPQGCAVPTKRVKRPNGGSSGGGGSSGSSNGNGNGGDNSSSAYYDDYYEEGSSGAAGGGYYDDGKDANHDWCYWCSIVPTPSPTHMVANSSSVLVFVEFPSNVGSDEDLFMFEEDAMARGLVWSRPESYTLVTGFEIQFLERIVSEGQNDKSYMADEDSILPATLWVGIDDSPAFAVEGISSTEEYSIFHAYTLEELLLVFTNTTEAENGKEYLLLDFEESYLIRIRAENKGGVGEWSAAQTVDFAMDSWIYESSEMTDPDGYRAQPQEINDVVQILQGDHLDDGGTKGSEHHTGYGRHARKANLRSEITEVKESATKFAEAMGVFRSMSLSASVVGLILGIGYVFGGRGFLTGGNDSSTEEDETPDILPPAQRTNRGSDYGSGN